MQARESINTGALKINLALTPIKASNKYLKTWTLYKYARNPLGACLEPVSGQRMVAEERAQGRAPLARAGAVPTWQSCREGVPGAPSLPKATLPLRGLRSPACRLLAPRQHGQRAPSLFNHLRSYLWYATKYLVVRRTACHRQLCC